MNENQLLRLIRLAQKTGDTLIVTDTNGENAVAIMDVNRYEALLDEGLDFDSEDLPDDFYTESTPILEILDPIEGGIEEEIEEIIPEPVLETQEVPVNIPVSETFTSAEASVDVDEELPGEERFYLEPIE